MQYTSFRNAAAMLQYSLYVENCPASFDDTEVSKTSVEQSKKLLLLRKCDLTGWQNNYSKL